MKVLWFMPIWTQSIIARLGATRVSEPEVKFIFFVLFAAVYNGLAKWLGGVEVEVTVREENA